MSFLRSSIGRWVLAACGVIAATSNATAQTIVLEAKQGESWTDRLLIPDIQTLSFRWKWNGREPATSASWQMTFTSPDASPNPSAIAGVGALVPLPSGGRLGEYGLFQVAASTIPSNAPRTFYIRLRSSGEYSSWIPIIVSDRAGSTTVRQTSDEYTRATSTVSTPTTGSGSFTIPGGGQQTPLFNMPDPYMPISIRLTGIECLVTASAVYSLFGATAQSLSSLPRLDVDKVYAVIAAIDVDRKSPAASRTYVQITDVLPLTRGSTGNLDVAAWGPPDGAPLGIPNGQFAIVAVVLLHRFNGPNLAIATTMIEAGIKKELSMLSATSSTDEIVKAARSIANSIIVKTLEPGDRRVSASMESNFLYINDDDLRLVRDGHILLRPMDVGSAYGGTFKIRVMLRK